jgi:hypothetical protein
MKALLFLPVFWLLTAEKIPVKKIYGEIIINNVPAWKPISISGKCIIELSMPELTSDFIARNNIKVAVKFSNMEEFKALPFLDGQSASPGTYEYSVELFKLKITFSPKAAGGSNGSSALPMEQISFNFTNITFE